LLGDTATTSLAETSGSNNKWNVTCAPLVSSIGTITGAIINLTPAGKRADLERQRFSQKPTAPKMDAQTHGLLQADLSQAEFLDSIPRMFFVVDKNARCVEANTNFLSVMKLTREAIIGHSLEEFLLDGDPANENTAASFAKAVREESFDNIECRVSSKNGDVLSLSLRGTRLQWEGEPRMLISCIDNTKLRRTEEQLKRVSTTDAATGTLNRQGMERALGTEIERAVRYRGSLSIIMLDIDGFRQLNERLGYAASDKILRDLAAAIKSRINLTDFLGRWGGGDEFMILTPLPLATAVHLAEKLRDMAQYMTFGENYHLTVSAGIAAFNKSMDLSSFVGAAYDAMVEAKRGGGNRIVQAQEQTQEHETQSEPQE
jgi:diguanylate cyclase (GGDEF)-like protein/PAS domain S-box-containing protein